MRGELADLARQNRELRDRLTEVHTTSVFLYCAGRIACGPETRKIDPELTGLRVTLPGADNFRRFSHALRACREI